MISEQNGLQEGNKASRAYVTKPCVLIAGRPALPRSAPHLPVTSGGDLLLLYNWFEGQRKHLPTKMSPLLYFFSWIVNSVQHPEDNSSLHPKSTDIYSFAIIQSTPLHQGHGWQLPYATFSIFTPKRCLTGNIKLPHRVWFPFSQPVSVLLHFCRIQL